MRGFPALDFNGGASVNTALADMACRFELASSTTLACTRDKFGNFAFLNSASTRQYCFQVSATSPVAGGQNDDGGATA